MGWNFYNASGELQINDGGVSAAAAVFTGNADLGSNLLVGNAGSTGIAISANGEVTMAAQPAFSAYMNSEMSNATGNGTTVTVEMDTEVFDQNADFNTSNYTFTAPVTGRYFLSTYVLVAGMAVDGTALQFHIDASNRDWYMESGSPYLSSQISANMAVLIDMDAADTAIVKCRGVSLGADTADIAGIDGALVRTMFTGFLVA
jgi:hypothetical protein